MLGTRIEDTLTLRRDCLSEKSGHYFITIIQQKTRKYKRPVSDQLAELIRKAIEVSEKEPRRQKYVCIFSKRILNFLSAILKKNSKASLMPATGELKNPIAISWYFWTTTLLLNRNTFKTYKYFLKPIRMQQRREDAFIRNSKHKDLHGCPTLCYL